VLLTGASAVHDDVVLRVLLGNLVEELLLVGRGVGDLVAEDLPEAGAGVLPVHVDLAGLQCLADVDRAGDAGLVGDLGAGVSRAPAW
jgi:hypothetical protein